MEVAILADTHVMSRAAAIPDWVTETVQSADHVIHAGDFDSRPAYEELDSLAASLTAVAGNMDHGLDLPTVATVDLAGVRFVVTHGDGPDEGYKERLAAITDTHAAGTTVGVGGHTHRVLDTEVDGYRLCNPGSATAAWPAQEETMLVATVAGGDVELALRRGD
ncbi:MJ0936 family phosphodiesterase [Natronomonas pharaonis DSM 2160]|uniref:Phosphoesterase n=1 Tax=Natronomonas pharaonis (strain ATCC 35678 / DSM 2160 / CIP 103997 / JCM 8858 / NBRC 14720 / NCIMB 2260 / Gabara) TaxID=348780 RepID=Q3ITB7_NATPD|nr:metallophosphoesterase family protein [Natronomonas pharaonis]CAI48617.1 MJ0936 family phosphodiesterase [Natronomonas pharaonis DSM 2160]